MGFEISPHDPCVANILVNGGQNTVCWHVDDLKISHRDKAIVSEFAMALADEFGPKTKIPRGKCTIMWVWTLTLGRAQVR